VPELANRVAGLASPLRADPETERYRLFDAVAAWLAATARDEPVLLVLDDLQWAAKPTLLLLRHVARSSERTRLLVLATYRDSEVGRTHPLRELVADLRRWPGVERVSLSGLDRSGVVAFIEQAVGRDLGEEGLALARAIHEETEGNPFFVEEVLRHLVETGAVYGDNGRWRTGLPVGELGIPEGVKDVIGRRLSRLSEAANDVLALAAVVGPEFELIVLGTAAGLSEDALISAVDEAVAARLVRDVVGAGARYRFAHALVRDTLYDELSAARRIVLHRRVGEAIELVHAAALDDHLPALAHHYARASAPSAATAKAVAYAARAGDRALIQLAHDEAVVYYRQALDFLDVAEGSLPEPGRLELLISLGEAQRRAGDPGYRETLLAAAGLAQEQGDAHALGRAALANTRGTLFPAVGAVDRERVAVLEEALKATGADDIPLRARLLATLGLELTWSDRERRLRLSDEALVLARRLGDAATLAEVLVARFHAIAGPDTYEERLANTAELLALAERLGDASIHSRALALRFRAVIEVGDLREADRCLEANERLTQDLGQPTLRWFVALQRAGRTLFSGRIGEAAHLAADARRAGEAAGQPDAPLLFLWQQFSVCFEQGQLGELIDELVRLVRDIPGLPATRAMMALAHAELDQPDQAREALRPMAASGFSLLPVDTIWLRAMTDSAAACAYIGDTGWAITVHQLLTPYAHLLPTACLGTPTGAVVHHLGLLATTLGRYEEAEAHFAAAEAIHARVEAPTWLARTRLEWARMLIARHGPGDTERARDLVGQALASARDLRLGTVERRALALRSQLP
jgi:tetratricopeptide (TPR) repeat protein